MPLGIAGDIVLIVVASLVGGLIAQRLRQPLLVGYILAGVFVGPNTGGPTVTNIGDVELLAEIGVALLLFTLGLELSLRELRAVRFVALIGGPLQIGLSALFGYLLASRLLGFSSSDALWFGAMISLSSTMVVLKTVAAQGFTTTLATRVMVGILIVQDLALVPMLVVLPRLKDGAGAGWVLLQSSLQAGVFLAAMVFVGTRVIPWILRRVASWESRELFLVTVVALGVGIGYGTYLFGLSFAFGAFVAGLVLSESEFSHQALADIVPLRDVFGILFFASVGMLFDPAFLVGNAGQVIAVVLLIVAGKSLVAGMLVRGFGYGNMAPWIVGLGLSQVGEFSFVLARVGLQSGSITPHLYSLVLTATVLSMLVSPALMRLSPVLFRLWRRVRPQVEPLRTMHLPEAPAGGHVVVAGYGRTGRVVVDVLRRAGIETIVVERGYNATSELMKRRIPSVWGDCASEAVLSAAYVDRARVLVLAVSDSPTIRQAVAAARKLNPRIRLVLRAVTPEDVQDLTRAGGGDIVQPESEGGIEMMRRTLDLYSLDPARIDALTEDARAALYGAAPTRVP